jgi:hypothetical protein
VSDRPTPKQLPNDSSDPRDFLEKLYQIDSVDEHPTQGVNQESLEGNLQKLADYIRSRSDIEVAKVKKNWGRNNDFSSADIDDMLLELSALGIVECYRSTKSRGEWVRWLD